MKNFEKISIRAENYFNSTQLSSSYIYCYVIMVNAAASTAGSRNIDRVAATIELLIRYL